MKLCIIAFCFLPPGSLITRCPSERRAGPGLHVKQLFYNHEDMTFRESERLVVTLDLIVVETAVST